MRRLRGCLRPMPPCESNDDDESLNAASAQHCRPPGRRGLIRERRGYECDDAKGYAAQRARLGAWAAVALDGRRDRNPSIPDVSALRLAPCVVGRSKTPARCGTFDVYENRAAHSGRVIALRILVVPARRESGHAIAFVPGGPGQSAVDLARRSPTARSRKSSPCFATATICCSSTAAGWARRIASAATSRRAAHPSAYFAQLWPDALVGACRAKTSATHDRAWYVTNAAVDDLDDVRAALHYPEDRVGRRVRTGRSFRSFSCGAMRRASRARSSSERTGRMRSRCRARPTGRSARSTISRRDAASMPRAPRISRGSASISPRSCAVSRAAPSPCP